MPITRLPRRAAAAIATLAIAGAPLAAAETLPVTLTLPAPGSTNAIALDAEVSTPVGSDTDAATMNLAGTVDALLDLDLSGATPVVTGITLTGGRITGSDTSLSFSILGGVASGTAVTTGVAGFANTPTPPGAVTAGSFDAALHNATLNEGSVVVNGNAPGLGNFGETTDLTVEPFTFTGSGTGTIALTALGGDEYAVQLLLPIDDSETDNITTGVDFTLAATGTVEALGTITVPEPASAALLIAGAIGITRRRRD